MKIWIAPTHPLPEVRGADAFGKGHFGASRKSRVHNGIDLVVIPGQDIFCPTDSTFVRYSYPYVEDTKYRGLWTITEDDGDVYESVVWYIVPMYFKLHEDIMCGERVGIAQNIALKYGAGMIPHVHWGVKRNGKWMDPMELLSKTDTTSSQRG